MKVQELINLINNEKRCYSIFDAEQFIEGEFNCVAENLNFDERRWYIISTSVYKLEDGYVGITGPSTLKSENMEWCDCNPCKAEEYEEFTTIAYRPKSFINI